MDINGHQDIDAVTLEDLVAEALEWDIKAGTAGEIVVSLLDRALSYIEGTQDKAVSANVPEPVLATLGSRTKRLLRGLSAAERR